MPETILGLSTNVLGIWLAALATLAIYSFLYKDNPIYKFAEHLFVGLSAGYSVGLAYHQVLIDLIWEPLFTPAAVHRLTPNYLVIIPTILGMLMFLRFSRKYGWISRYTLCFIFGWGAGAGIPRIVQFLLKHVHSTFVPLLPHDADAGVWQVWAGISALIMVVAVITTLCYFYFSKEHKGALGVAGRIGIWFLMISFGASFGYTIMARLSLLIGRVTFLFRDWLHITQ